MEALYPIIAALAFNFMDLLTGLIAAVKKKKVKSSKLRDGLFKKVGFVLCYVVAIILDTQGSKIGIKIGVPVLPAIVLYTCVTELVSIIENICMINPDLMPDKLMQLFNITETQKGELK